LHLLEMVKPDGRRLTLYGRQPISVAGEAPSPRKTPLEANPHLRWHPYRGEWVAYAAHRQDRTFLPPAEFNPLLPASDPAAPTELPAGQYDVAVFENLFPALAPGAHDAPPLDVPTRPARGLCEVVVFTQDPAASLGTLEPAHLELLLEVWGDRSRRLAADPAVRYVLPFENRGAEVGVTLHHPHGQIYAYPFLPPVPARMLAREAAHWRKSGVTLLAHHLAREADAGTRVVYAGERALAFVPAWARFPYEVWIAPRAPVARLQDLADGDRADLALALKTVLLAYDGLWGRPMPYIMAWYQAPADGRPHEECHVHVELLPARRAPDRLKYLAGTELAAGMFASDVLPEEAAARLQAVRPDPALGGVR
jgi:UDPglucose--hexose-1-phosphate uridylyltransferase